MKSLFFVMTSFDTKSISGKGYDVGQEKWEKAKGTITVSSPFQP